MATLIHLKTNHAFYTEMSITEVKSAVELGQQIPIWWYASFGRRYQEMLFVPNMDEVGWLQTESDD